MPIALVVRSKCRRHILASERRCPFCSTSGGDWIIVAAALAASATVSACGPATPATTTPAPPPAVAPAPAVMQPSDPAASAPATLSPPAPEPPRAVEPSTSTAAPSAGTAAAYGPPPGSTSDSTADAGWVQVGRVEVDGALAVQDVLRVVRQKTGQLRGCYPVGHREKPDQRSWTASVSFQVSETGKGMGVRVDSADIPGPGARICLEAVTRQMEFPMPPRGASIVRASFEVTFAPAPHKPPGPRF
jgi:hypothetical protein